MYYKDCKTKYDVIDAFSRDKKLRKEIEGICKSKQIDDLLQEIYLSLLEKSDELILGLNKREQIKYYIIRMVISQYHSKTSRYYKLFKKNHLFMEIDNEINSPEEMGWFEIQQQHSYMEFIDNELNIDRENDIEKDKTDKLIFINDEINNLNWYDKQIFLLYIGQKTSFTKLSKKLNISRNSLFNTVNNVKKQIISNYNAK